MPKRKRNSDISDTYDYISRKIKKLERKLRRHANKDRSSSSRSSTPQRSEHQDSEIMEPGIFISDEECNTQVTEVITENSPPSVPNNDQRSGGTVVPPPRSIIEEPQASTSTAQEPQLTSGAEVNELDSTTLALLGEDPTSKELYGKGIQKDLALRFGHWATVGLCKDLRDQLTARYLTPDNCTLIDPPSLNAEIKAAVSDVVSKRDKAIEIKQKQLSVALSGIGEVITKMLLSKEKDDSLVKTLMDVGRIVCDSQHRDSMTRKYFILCTLKKDMKEQLQNTKIDKFLFSENLSETLKLAKAINRSCADLKNNPASRPRPQGQKVNTSTPRNLNWRGAPAPRRQPTAGAPRTKTSAPAPMKHRHQNPSRTSHNQPGPGRSRR